MPPFPESERVIYDSNPLDEVICQLRFPTLLRIDAELPAAFQESVRGVYPILRETRSTSLPLGLPPELSDLLSRALPQRVSYDFATKDDKWVAALTRDFLALTAREYRSWDAFRTHLLSALDALVAVYDPAPFTRIGLRYRDVICRSAVGLADQPWSELLRPHLSGELADGDVGSSIREARRETLVDLSVGQVRIRHGLVEQDATEELCYVIDSDFFTEEPLEAADAVERLNEFNRQAGRLFRWCITDRLHHALGPRPA